MNITEGLTLANRAAPLIGALADILESSDLDSAKKHEAAVAAGTTALQVLKDYGGVKELKGAEFDPVLIATLLDGLVHVVISLFNAVGKFWHKPR